MSPWLDADELKELAGRQRWSAQARKLSDMGIRFILSGVGRPLVERSAVLKEESRNGREEPRRRGPGPDWSKLKTRAKKCV